VDTRHRSSFGGSKRTLRDYRSLMPIARLASIDGSHMRFALALLSVILLVPDARAEKPLDRKAVDAIVRDAMKSWQVPGAALAIVRNGEVVYLQAYGVRTAGGQEAVTPDTLFAIGVLVDEGTMAWDDPVRKHLPWFRRRACRPRRDAPRPTLPPHWPRRARCLVVRHGARS